MQKSGGLYLSSCCFSRLDLLTFGVYCSTSSSDSVNSPKSILPSLISNSCFSNSFSLLTSSSLEVHYSFWISHLYNKLPSLWLGSIDYSLSLHPCTRWRCIFWLVVDLVSFLLLDMHKGIISKIFEMCKRDIFTISCSYGVLSTRAIDEDLYTK